jgi:hypothetical protein
MKPSIRLDAYDRGQVDAYERILAQFRKMPYPSKGTARLMREVEQLQREARSKLRGDVNA